MRTPILTAIILLVSFMGYAQSANYVSDMQKGINMLDTAKSQTGYQTTATYMERMANTHEKEWLSQYYAAYSYLILGIRGKENEEAKDESYDKAMGFANKANALNPNNGEVYVLKAYIIFMKMAVDPVTRAMNMIPESNALLEKAIALDPENPRAYLLKGQNMFYTPELFAEARQMPKQFWCWHKRSLNTLMQKN